MENQLLNISELAEYLNIGRSSAYSVAHSEGFPVLKLGKRLLIPKQELLAWIKENVNKNY